MHVSKLHVEIGGHSPFNCVCVCTVPVPWDVQPWGVWKLLAYASAPFSAMKQIISVVQMIVASKNIGVVDVAERNKLRSWLGSECSGEEGVHMISRGQEKTWRRTLPPVAASCWRWVYTRRIELTFYRLLVSYPVDMGFVSIHSQSYLDRVVTILSLLIPGNYSTYMFVSAKFSPSSDCILPVSFFGVALINWRTPFAMLDCRVSWRVWVKLLTHLLHDLPFSCCASHRWSVLEHVSLFCLFVSHLHFWIQSNDCTLY